MQHIAPSTKYRAAILCDYPSIRFLTKPLNVLQTFIAIQQAHHSSFLTPHNIAKFQLDHLSVAAELLEWYFC